MGFPQGFRFLAFSLSICGVFFPGGYIAAWLVVGVSFESRALLPGFLRLRSCCGDRRGLSFRTWSESRSLFCACFRVQVFFSSWWVALNFREE